MNRERFCTQFHPTLTLVALLPFVHAVPGNLRMLALFVTVASFYVSRYFAKADRELYFHGKELSDVPEGGLEFQGKYTREFMILCVAYMISLGSLAAGVHATEWVLFAAGNQAVYNLCRGAIKKKQAKSQIQLRSLHV